jgi:carbamoyltransferase
MEFGPRALGARSILGDARDRDMQAAMNRKIKFRESFRPFAPIVLRDRATEYFELNPEVESPYMLLVAQVRDDKRSVVPAITHVDHSARIQTVDRQRHPRLHALLESFAGLTGCPVMINTSFNIRGEPIVCSPGDAYRCFMATGLDVLVIDDFLLLKEAQPESAQPNREAYLATYGDD